MPAVQLLSTPGIFVGAERVVPPKGKTSALLYYLAYQGDWVSRDDLLYLLWSDTDLHKARRNLRQLLSFIRKLPFTRDLETTGWHLRWSVPSDTRRFKEALSQKKWADAVECYHGALLEGFRTHRIPESESWLELERASSFSHCRAAVFELSAHLQMEGRYL